jgi:thioredoxin-like negative regulator of GroEL
MSHKTEIVVMLFFSDTNYVSLITKTVLGEVVKKCFRGFNIKVKEVNYDSEKELCMQYGVNGVPVTLVFCNDELIGRHHGEITFKEFKAMLQDYCVPQE